MTEIIDIVEPYITGPQGASGTIESATAVGLAPGADPTVTLGGTPEQRTIEFGIPEGEQGTPAAITGATAETLPPGSNVTVTVGGSPAARTFAFGIPKGDPGSGSVNSVNGDTGPDVVLNANDVGAVPTTQYASTTERGIIELATNQESIIGSDSQRAVTPSALKATLAERAVGSVDLISRIRYPLTIAHRGGPLVSPEHSMEGYVKAFESGFTPEADVRALSDGTLVCLHDATTNRTMSVNNTVSGMSRTQWEAASVLPAKHDARYTSAGRGTPVYFDDYLDRFGGKTVLFPELKTSAQADIDAFVNAIMSRGLAGSVVAQTGFMTVANQFVAAGLSTLYLSDSANPVDIAAAGVSWIGVSQSATETFISSCKAAGLKVLGFTVKTRSEQTAMLGKGCDGVFSDDPWETSRLLGNKSEVDISDSAIPPASDFNYGNSGGNVGSSQSVEVANGAFLFSTNEASAVGSMVKLGQFGYDLTSCRVRFWAQSYRPKQTSSPENSWIFGVYLGTQTDDVAVNETSGVSKFRLVMVRRNGEQNIYERPTDGGSTTKIATRADSENAPVGGRGPALQFEVVFTPTTASVVCLSKAQEPLTITHGSWAAKPSYLTIAVLGAEGAIWGVTCERI